MKRRVSTAVATAPGRPLAYVTGGELCLPPDVPRTLIAALVAAAERATAGDIRYCLPSGKCLDCSFAELIAQSERIAGGLRELKIAAGECVIVLLDTNQQILPAFWGCLLSGAVPVIAPLPADLSDGSRALGQLFATWTHLGQPAVIVTEEHQELHAALTCQGGISAERLATIESLLSHERDDRHHAAQPDDVAFLSLTSGSTGLAKCVELTHHNVLSRAYGTNQLGRHTASDVILNWLPLDHIGSLSDWHLRCVLLGCRMVYVAKDQILARPLTWLELLEDYRVTHSWAPNFAYGLLAEAVAREDSRQWNLSCVKGLVTAGEGVSPKTNRRLLDLLGPCALAPSAIRPAFGMAEMASGVTYGCGTGDLEIATAEGGKTTSLASLGPPIPGIELRIVDEDERVVAEETVGQLQVRGAAVSRGYFRSTEASRVFHADGWFDTGDLGFLSEGELYLTGRAKDTIIVRGANFSCAQIEDVVQSVAGVESSFTAACPVRNGSDEESLAIFFHTRLSEPGEVAALVKAIRREVVRQVGVNPEYLLPVDQQAISKTAIGKIQRQQLKDRFERGEFDELLANVNAWLRAAQPQADAPTPQTDIERQVADVWIEVLGLDSVSLHQNVFELGAHSLLLAQVHQRLQAALACQLSIVEMFKYPTIHQLARRISGETNHQGPAKIGQQQAQRRRLAFAEAPTGVAVIGMAGRFPGAANLNQFWRNLRNGVESIAHFTEAQVLDAGIDPARARDPKYVKAGPVLDGVEQFDAEFFGYTPREAELMDPQQRLLLECSWEAMENAGYNLLAYDGTVGVYAGALLNTYLLNNVLPGKRHLAEGEQSTVLTPDSLAGFLTMIASDKDYLTTRVSYKLNLRGPSINVQTACSTSLVAVHMAAESILAGQCDLALAGGVSVKVPQEAGYLYEDDLIVSPDGHCRPMDAAASGTVFGNGCGVVVLKRLDRAIADRDHIYAVIRSSAVNNDGARKVGYMAPSQDGQAAVVAEAIAKAGIEPESIGFIEAHGTATALGDPIEVAGLADAFRSGSAKTGFCALGSVKSNVGHLQIASGIAGFIKAVLALYHKQIPPSLHFEKPNPRIDFSQSPFFVNSRLLEWPNGSEPRRAGVNSLGIGGTNAHVILEESSAPAAIESRDHGREYLLVLSATSKPALRELAGRYVDYLHAHRDISLVDLCYTANGGRVHFAERAVCLASSIDELCEQLKAFVAGQDAIEVKAPAAGNDRVRELRNLAERFAAGLPVDWEPVFQGDQPRRVPLPTYPFQRKRYWIDRPKISPLRKLLHPVGENTFEAVLDASAWPAQHEHRLCGQPVAPGALHLALMLDAAREVADHSSLRLESVRFQHLLPLAANKRVIMQVGLQPVERGWTTQVRGLCADEETRTWASGLIIAEEARPLPAWALAATQIDQIRARCPRKMAGDDFYRGLQAFDVQLGPAFQTIAHVVCGQHEALARIRLAPAGTLDCDTQMQPVLLDGALQLAPALFDLHQTETQIPTGIQAFTLLQQCRETELWCYVRLQPNHTKSGSLVVDALLLDDKCQPVALLEGISYQGVARERLLQLVARVSKIKTLPPSPISANGSAPNRQRALTDFIRQELNKALGLRNGQPLPADRGFSELGLDSLTSVELRNRLQQRLGCSLPATVVFDYPTINQLVAMLLVRPDVKLPMPDQAATIPAASNGKPKAARKPPPTAPLPIDSPNAVTSDPRQERFAIVGMSCRFPGGSNSPEEFWEFLQRGGDASRDVPADRFDIEAYYHADRSQPGTIATRRGCFLDNIDQFDAAHFGIAPREAHTLDPQQRLLLEVAHEAMENAGVPINSLDGTKTGVFVGMSGIDYAILSSRDQQQIGPYLGTGTAHATACGRLSYVLGLQGPSLSVDTACSSSLVAVHLACQSLARGECDLALAAGVNLVTAPQIMISFSKAQMLSADGRCKTFDASADGYVRGEGAGVLVLKRLSVAIKDHDRILAVIRGTAVNQDGKSSGLTVPSGPAQEKVIRSALAAAGVAPAQVSYIEAHGTGTPLGDSIELEALRNVYAAGRADPLIVGSVKTNIGHTEAVSGMAGLIKVVLALEHQQIPRHLHFENPNPHVEWDGMKVPTECLPWISTSGPRLAGVSSFGFGGTNAHVVVEQAPASVASRTALTASERPFQVLTISAKNAAALNDLSSRYREHLELPNTGWGATCAAAALARAHWPHRLAVIAASNEDAAAKLESFAAAGSPEVIRGDVSEAAPQVALLFSGQGSQYAGMGRELYETEPRFRRTLDRCNEILRPYLPSSLLAALFPTGSDKKLLDQTAFTQPALFALEYSLWELWKSWGLAPSVLLGHSVGEYVAACAAGVFDLEDGLRLIATRGRLVQSLPAGGAMCAVMAPAEWVEMALAQVEHQAGVAAVNGPRQVVVSGECAAVEQVARAAEAAGIRTQMLAVSHAFHSHLLDPILDEFYAVASSVTFRPPALPIISNLTGELADADLTTPEYWCQHLRHPVQFARGIQTAANMGCEVFVEAGPQATLAAMGRQCLPEGRFRWLPSLGKSGADWKTMLTSLATLHVSGVSLAWDKIYDQRLARQQVLPTYPFQRQRYWLPEPSNGELRMNHHAAAAVHPLLGHETRLPDGGALYEAQLSAASPAFLADHQVQGRPLFPGAGFVEALVAAGQRLLRSPRVQLRDVEFVRALPLSAEQSERVEIQITPANAEFQAQFFRRISSADDEPTWTLHAASRIGIATAGEAPLVDLGQLQSRLTHEQATAEFYHQASESGLEYGPAFQRLTGIWHGQREALGRFESSPAIAAQLDDYTLHPALLDAAFQVVGVLLPSATEGTYLPVGVESIEVFSRLPANGYSHVRLRDELDGHGDVVLADVDLIDHDGHVKARITGFRLKKVSLAAFRQLPKQQPNEWLYEVAWRQQPQTVRRSFDEPGGWLLVGGNLPLTRAVASSLRASGQIAVAVESASSLAAMASEMSPPPQGVVLIASDFATTEIEKQNGHASPGGEPRLLAETALQLVQSLVSREPQCRLYLVTRGAVAVNEAEGVPGVAQSPLWGMGGVIAAEHPELLCTRIDLDPASEPVAAAESLVSELAAADREDRVALRSTDRFVARLKSYQLPAAELLPPPDGPYRLQLAEFGVLENLQLAPLARRLPAPGEVEIAVAAAGLNFRDVLRALGMLRPFESSLGITTAADAPFGFECAGTIAAVGEGITDFAVGDEIVGVALGSMRSHVIASSRQVAHKPANLSMVEAATLPLAFLTASHALEQLASLQPGAKVLIHAAAGGVGLAAVQLALARGAEVFATASPPKWDFLRSLGVKHIFNSRTLDFSEEISRQNDGQGVDVVLNSLTGDFIAASLKSLRERGVFVEIGKLGIWSSDQMSSARPDVRYFAFDLGEEEARQPGMMGRLLKDVLRRMEQGELTPLPHRAFPLTAARQAFRLVAQAGHRGKVVLTLTQQSSKLSLRPDGWYLITGGLGALGLKTAEWLIDQGARHVALLGRTIAQSEAQLDALARLREKNADVQFVQADVANRDALADALAQIPGPLCGLIHAAGVLDDGLLHQLDQSRLARVLAPKVNGAWNLHELTRGQPLDFFVCFSSAAALLGSPGQANYAAANAFLDSLALHRRALGLPALSVNWGPWAEGGMAARLSERECQRLAKMGLGWIDADMGLRLLGQLLADDAVQAAVLPIDWPRYLSSSNSQAAPFYQEVQDHHPRQPPAPPPSILVELQAAEAAERNQLMVDYLRSEIAAVLGFDPKAISPRSRLFDLGMDSLTAVELQNRIQRGLSIDMPTTLAFDYPTPNALANYLLDRLGLAMSTSEQPDEADAVLTAQVEQYTDDEVKILLREKYQDVLKEQSS